MAFNAYIVEAVRTAGGRKNGWLSQWHPVDLGAEVIRNTKHNQQFANTLFVLTF